MPIACLLILLAPIPVAMIGAGMEYSKEQKVNEICVQNFKNVDDIKQCKSVLMRVNINDNRN